MFPQAFVQALWVMVIFGIKIQFSGKGTHLQEPTGKVRGRAEPSKFCDFVHSKASQVQFEWPTGGNFYNYENKCKIWVITSFLLTQ